MAAKYKLSYFNVTALGEPIRFLFHYGGIDFEDHRFEREQWATLKSTMPFGQAPVLYVNDKMINQSSAIARYVAKLVKLAGHDELHALEIDAMVENINDLRQKISQYWYESDEQVKQAKKDPLFKEIIPYYLAKLDKAAKECSGYFIRGELSWADMYFVGLLDYLNHMIGFDITDRYPNLAAVKYNVTTIESIKKYLQSRPKTDF